MLNQQVNPYTLIPTTNILQTNLHMDSSSKLPLIAITFILFASLSFFFGLINLFISLGSGDSYSSDIILIVCDLSRIAYYSLVLIFGKRNHFIRIFGTYIFPCFFSAMITEVLIYIGQPSDAVVRYCCFFHFK